MSRKRSDSETEAENSGQAFQNDVDDLYGAPDEETEEDEEEEKKDK